MKKLGVISAIVTSSLIFGAVGVYAGSNLEEISAYLNKDLHIKLQGKDWTPKDADGSTLYPITYNGSTYLPVRAASEALGIKVGYDADTNTVLLDDAQPTAETSRSYPADIGKKIHYAVEGFSDNYEANISVDQVIRGDNAWTMIQQANQFNDPPAAGKEYMLAKITFEVTKNQKSDSSINVYGGMFTLVSSSGKDYDLVSIVPPNPSIDAKLYAGASQTGWAVFQVDKTDQNPVITFGRDFDGTGGLWFKTK